MKWKNSTNQRKKMQIYHIHTDKNNRKYIIRESIFGDRKCYYKRGCKEFHDYDNGIEIKGEK